MDKKEIPYLCGGTFFSLILQARKTRTKARDKLHGGTDGLKDTDVMMGLVEVVTGNSFDSAKGSTFGKCTTQFKTCQKYGTTYIPFTDHSVISSFNSSLKQKNSNLLKRMSEFINKYVNKMCSEWLVKALFELIMNDEEIPQDIPFSISDGQTATKNELNSISQVELSIFLLSVISFILNERKDNTKGRPTFESWHTQSGPNSPWKYESNIGNSITKTITVNTNHEIIRKKFIDNTDSELSSSQQLNSDIWGSAIKYLSDEKEDKKTTKTEPIELSKEQLSEEFPYSSEDKILLHEFTTDYDEIMCTLIGQNYGVSLIDMSLPYKIQDLYNTKWNSKAEAFINLTLKSYIYGLLGELNTLSNSFLLNTSTPSNIKSVRKNIRNLYVKLHPDSFSRIFPYDAFIDDWDDGEY